MTERFARVRAVISKYTEGKTSLSQIERDAGVPDGALRQYFRKDTSSKRKAPPSFDFVSRVAGAIGCPPQELDMAFLLDLGIRVPQPMSPATAAVIAIMEQLSEDQQNEVVRYARDLLNGGQGPRADGP